MDIQFVCGTCCRGGHQPVLTHSFRGGRLFQKKGRVVLSQIVIVCDETRDVLAVSVSSGSCAIDYLDFPHRAGEKLHVCISFRQPRRYQPVCLSVSLVPERGFMSGRLGTVGPDNLSTLWHIWLERNCPQELSSGLAAVRANKGRGGKEEKEGSRVYPNTRALG